MKENKQVVIYTSSLCGFCYKAKTLLNSYLITPTQAKKAGISIEQDGIRKGLSSYFN